MKQAEIWEINLSPTIGAEIRKVRPAVIINDDAMGVLPLRVIAPITGWKNQFQNAPWMVKLTPATDNNLQKISTADCFQIRSISTRRFIRKIGTVSIEKLEQIKEAVKAVIDAD
ncbi:MAG: PemK family transcriptional regulator [Desulfobacteraceae bacterium 4572_187]|nr:MAG: PemK family transcriptional regulator [Desulfobacteraceae bacterium 4572_187]